MKTQVYTVNVNYHGETKPVVGTLNCLLDYFTYRLAVGKDYEDEAGNKKINREPTDIISLIDNLNNASNNAAAYGYPVRTYSLAS